MGQASGQLYVYPADPAFFPSIEFQCSHNFTFFVQGHNYTAMKRAIRDRAADLSLIIYNLVSPGLDNFDSGGRKALFTRLMMILTCTYRGKYLVAICNAYSYHICHLMNDLYCFTR